jgi:hypothetical protein
LVRRGFLNHSGDEKVAIGIYSEGYTMFNFTAKFLLTADESNLNGFAVMSLEDFLIEEGGGVPHTAADDDEPETEESEKDSKTDKKKPKKEEEFGFGAKSRPMEDEEMREYADRIMQNRDETVKKQKQKYNIHDMNRDKYNLPYLHGSNIPIVNEGGKEYDLAALKIQIMKRPDKLLKQNEKMQHSQGPAEQFYNIGLPALKGLAVNEKTGKFVVVDTCPGSGLCKTYCYAMRGKYVQFGNTSMNLSRMLNFLLNNPEKFKARLKAEIGLALADADDNTQVVIRWHDAGDFFSPQYMNMAFDIARSFPEVKFYAYTKMADVVNAKKPNNFIVSFSEDAQPREVKKVDLTQIKQSRTVPQKMFWDLIVTKGAHTVKDAEGRVQFKSAEAWDEFKNRLVATYKIPKQSILFYNQYMEMSEDGSLGDTPNYWNVVVPPGGGDNSSNDALVGGTYLMWH